MRKANEGAEQKWNSEEKIEKTQEAYYAASHQKKSKAKAPKEKVFWKLMPFLLMSNHKHLEVVSEVEREEDPEVTAEVTVEVTTEVASEVENLTTKEISHPCDSVYFRNCI